MVVPQDIAAFVKKALSTVDSLNDKVEKLKAENARLSGELKKVSEQKVILEKVAKQQPENKVVFSEEHLTKFASILNTTTALDEEKIKNICQNVNKDPGVLMTIFGEVLKSASRFEDASGRSTSFSVEHASNDKIDYLWKEAARR